ncbi:MAG: hypothetical protein PWQ88_473 [Candidatus Methanomethylophilaceae archaeon]|nr:hypothetical protein [Candidatus Methanomethylophilaceae archaeon]
MIGRKSVFIMLCNVIAALIGFLALTSMTRFVGEAYGSIMWAMSFVATFNALSDLGFSSANVKRVSEGRDPNDCLSTFLTVKVGLTAVMMVATVGFLMFYTAFMGKDLYTADMPTLLLFVLYWALCNLSSVFTNTFNARLEVSKSEAIHLIDPLIRSPVVVILAVNQASAAILALVYVIGALAALIVGIFMLRRSGIRFVRPTMFRSYLSFARPLIIIVFFSSALARLDVLLLGYFWNALEVGYYSSAYKLVELVLTFGTAINVLLFPTFSEWHINGRYQKISDTAQEAQRFMSMMAMPISVFLAVFAFPVAEIVFGTGYRNAGGPLMVSAIMLYVCLLIGIQSQILLGYNRPDLSARTQIVRLLINIVLLVVFIPTSFFGVPMLEMKATGAAMATLISWIALAVIVNSLTARIAGVTAYKGLWKHILCGALTAVLIFALSILIPMTDILIMLLLAFITVAIFLALLYLCRELRREDLEVVWNAIDPIAMYDYVRDELKGKRR